MQEPLDFFFFTLLPLIEECMCVHVFYYLVIHSMYHESSKVRRTFAVTKKTLKTFSSLL